MVFEKCTRPTTPDTYFKEAQTFEMKRKLVNEKSMTGTLLGKNKTGNEGLLTKWLDNQIYVRVKTFTYLKPLQIIKLQHSVLAAILKIFLFYSIFPKTY